MGYLRLLSCKVGVGDQKPSWEDALRDMIRVPVDQSSNMCFSCIQTVYLS